MRSQKGLTAESEDPDFEAFSISAIDNVCAGAMLNEIFSGKADPGDEACCLHQNVSGLPFRADTIWE